MNIIAILQARMRSSRLPGKVLMDICGKTMVARVIERVKKAEAINKIVIATTKKPDDDEIVNECKKTVDAIYRGSEEDVLDRYYCTAKKYGAHAIVRITCDCPLIEPTIIDRVVRAFLKESPDYASNTLERTYPRGLDVEIMTKDVLKKAWEEAEKPYERTHVTPYIYQHSKAYNLLSVKNAEDLSVGRWTVDTQEDLLFIREIYSQFKNQEDFSWRDVISLLVKNPQLREINGEIQQKHLEEC
jgi:spore coat polysaccharide biosynthesis protein SpsF